MKIGADYYFYHNDHIGTPQKLTSVSGAVVWSANYGSFGKATVEVGTVTNNLRFPGQYYDSETGLHYNYHRYYDPSTGTYLTSDPIGLEGGINLFAYVQNNPVNWIDPYGLTGLEATIGGGAYAAGGGSLAGAAGAAAWVAGPVASGALGYYGTQALIEGTWLGEGGLGDWLYDKLHPPALEARKKKYQKPENPNKRKGADERKQSGERERNVGHPNGEEHSRRPKGGNRCP